MGLHKIVPPARLLITRLNTCPHQRGNCSLKSRVITPVGTVVVSTIAEFAGGAGDSLVIITDVRVGSERIDSVQLRTAK